MKKLFITLPILLISIVAMAQNKPVEAKKPQTMANPIVTPHSAATDAKFTTVDTMYHLKPVDVFNRAYILQRAVLLVLRPDDFSVNEKKFITRSADSLSMVDGTWYNGVKGVKKP